MRSVVTPGRQYDVVAGDRLRTQALVLARLTDPALGAGVGARRVHVDVLAPLMRAHVSGGFLVLTGRPELALATLATADALLDLRVYASGLRPQEVTIRVPATSDLPYTAADILLAVPPIALVGRVSEVVFPHSAVAGARVRVAGPTPGGQIVALRSPLAHGHAVGTTVREATLTALASTTLAQPAAAGAHDVVLTALASVGAGRVLALGTVERLEHAVVVAVDGTTSVARLRAPLVRTWSAGTPVTVTAVGAPANPAATARPVLPGDAVLVSGSAPASEVVEIADVDPALVEYRQLGAVADADGYWRQDGVRALPSVQLTVSATGFTTAGPTTYPLDPARDPNVIDVDLTV